MEKIINRDIYLSRLIDKKENGLIKVITGIRRCGKSYLLFCLFRDYLISSGVKEEQIISIALDDDSRHIGYINLPLYTPQWTDYCLPEIRSSKRPVWKPKMGGTSEL